MNTNDCTQDKIKYKYSQINSYYSSWLPVDWQLLKHCAAVVFSKTILNNQRWITCMLLLLVLKTTSPALVSQSRQVKQASLQVVLCEILQSLQRGWKKLQMKFMTHFGNDRQVLREHLHRHKWHSISVPSTAAASRATSRVTVAVKHSWNYFCRSFFTAAFKQPVSTEP